MTEACRILFGALIGYLAVSVCESWFHRAIGHAPPRFRSFLRKARMLGAPFLQAWYAHHVVHHFRTYRQDHVTQFACPEEEQRLRSRLIGQGHRRVVEQGYGVRVGSRPSEFLRHVGPTLPALFLVCWWGGSPWFAVGAALPLLAMPLLSEFVHPYLHMSHERAAREAPALLCPLIATRYFRFAARHHWLHHRYLDCNYNLLLGGDLLLGVHRRPSPEDLAGMDAVGLCTAGCLPGSPKLKSADPAHRLRRAGVGSRRAGNARVHGQQSG